MGHKSHCSLLAYINICKELLLNCLRDKAKIAPFSKLPNFYFDLRSSGQTPGRPRGKIRAKTRPQGQLECVNPQRSPEGGGEGRWSGLELTGTLISHPFRGVLGLIPFPKAVK